MKKFFILIWTLFIAVNVSAQRTWKIGDFYNVKGKRGIVFSVTSDGKHGMIISLDDNIYCKFNEAASWCRSHGTGWRLPTISELKEISNRLSWLNKALAKVDGDKLLRVPYWSSWETDLGGAVVRLEDGWLERVSKYYDLHCVRAVSAF